jgi:hypothetical protein
MACKPSESTSEPKAEAPPKRKTLPPKTHRKSPGRDRPKIKGAPKKDGPPSQYTKKLDNQVCELLASGETVNNICAMPHMPSVKTLYKWRLQYPGFGESYARAR